MIDGFQIGNGIHDAAAPEHFKTDAVKEIQIGIEAHSLVYQFYIVRIFSTPCGRNKLLCLQKAIYPGFIIAGSTVIISHVNQVSPLRQNQFRRIFAHPSVGFPKNFDRFCIIALRGPAGGTYPKESRMVTPLNPLVGRSGKVFFGLFQVGSDLRKIMAGQPTKCQICICQGLVLRIFVQRKGYHAQCMTLAFLVIAQVQGCHGHCVGKVRPDHIFAHEQRENGNVILLVLLQVCVRLGKFAKVDIQQATEIGQPG